ncbi:MAG TPA: RNA polymerase sigma-70 factor [Acidimicrobiales bacterium]|nr:RNA polymerase sigma-70 factor [Acidimicrobiales bacterium]
MPGRSLSPDDVVVFEEWRLLLFGIAYRMLGSATDAEDMVQETYLRWLQRDQREIESVRAYLVTIVTRLCIDQLGSARVQRATYVGPWLPEPIVIDDTSAVEQADTLSLAFLVLLEELTPPERAAYLLHDVFGYQFHEVADMTGRTTAGCRQLASRARSRIENRRQRFDADARHGQELTRRFVLACATGDLDGLTEMLAEDVVVWTDGGGAVRAAMRPVVGRHRSSRFLMNVAKRVSGSPREVTLNGQPAMVIVDEDKVVATLVLDIVEGTVVGVRSVTNPQKLEHLGHQLVLGQR